MRLWVSIETRWRVANTSYLDRPLPKRGEGNEELCLQSTVKQNRLHFETESPTIFVAPGLRWSVLRGARKNLKHRANQTVGPRKDELPTHAASQDPTPFRGHQAYDENRKPYRAQLGCERKGSMQNQPYYPRQSHYPQGNEVRP